jgi:hypothetical protein
MHQPHSLGFKGEFRSIAKVVAAVWGAFQRSAIFFVRPAAGGFRSDIALQSPGRERLQARELSAPNGTDAHH